MGKLDGQRIALLIGPGFEESEAIYPFYRLQEEGARVEVLGVDAPGQPVAGKHGVPMTVDRSVRDAAADQYDALVLPGGRGPDAIRANPDVIRLTQQFFAQKKPVAAICHGPQILISADVLRGVRCTSYKSVAPDVKNAGALYEDRETVVDPDAKLVTARQPSDLPAWLRATIDVFAGSYVAS
ncbi:MAG: type 1 glutamine amidotransferase [Actinomycetia bacterium]|nr:type 1 glutamine amidotransferase [Actinomycetes bacterium]